MPPTLHGTPTSAAGVQAPNQLAPDRAPFEQIGAGLADIFEGLRRAAAEGILLSAFLSTMVVLGGFGSFYLAWRGAAGTLAVGVQLAFLLSGGIGGFALIGAGMGIMYVQMSRHLAAREDRAWALVLDRALAILERIRAGGRLRRTATQHDVAR